MLMARSYRDDRRFRAAADYLLADLEERAARARRTVPRAPTRKRATRR
jgi:hypothetical protein